MFFELNFNKIELQAKLDINYAEFYAYFALFFFFEILSGTRHC